MCQYVKLPDGNVAIVCGAHKPQFCHCGRAADFLCDWKMPERQSGTCDAAMCKEHSIQVASGKHLCRWHQKAWTLWKKQRGIPEQGDLFENQADKK